MFTIPTGIRDVHHTQVLTISSILTVVIERGCWLMKNSNVRFILFLVIGLVIGFGATSIFTGNNGGQDQASSTNEAKATQSNNENEQDSKSGEEAQESTIPAEYDIIANKGCIQCHSIDALNIDEGKVGPDLSHIYTEIGDKRGTTLDKFLTQPTTAVMSSVISGNPLTDKERQQIITVLKKASEQ